MTEENFAIKICVAFQNKNIKESTRDLLQFKLPKVNLNNTKVGTLKK